MNRVILTVCILIFANSGWSAASVDSAMACQQSLTSAASSFEQLLKPLNNAPFQRLVRDGNLDAFMPQASSLASSASLLHGTLKDRRNQNPFKIDAKINACSRHCAQLSKTETHQRNLRIKCGQLVRLRSAIISYSASNPFDIPKIEAIGKKLEALQGTNRLKEVAKTSGDIVVAALRKQQAVPAKEAVAPAQSVATNAETANAEGSNAPEAAATPQASTDRIIAPFKNDVRDFVQVEEGVVVSFRPLANAAPTKAEIAEVAAANAPVAGDNINTVNIRQEPNSGAFTPVIEDRF